MRVTGLGTQRSVMDTGALPPTNPASMMKPLLSSSAWLLASAAVAQQVLINQDFESLDPGDPIAQAAGLPWTTWSNAPGGAEDSPASNEQAHSGAMSARFTSSSTQGGPTDIMLPLGNRTSGSYLQSRWMHVEPGKGGCFILQKCGTAGQNLALDVMLRATGGIERSPTAQAGRARPIQQASGSLSPWSST